MSGTPNSGDDTPPSNRHGEARRARRAQRRERAAARAAQRRRSPFRWLARMLGALVTLATIGAVAAAVTAFVGYKHYSADLPDVDGLRSYQPRVMSRVYASDAGLIAELATERRIFVPLSAIPKIVQQAFISAEDQNYWTHPGIDPVAIARAIITDVQYYGSGRRPVGASTITQQVAKNILLDNSLSIARKARELILAVRIENSLTKERILELYLNEIYLGLQAYGVAAAAQSYFNKSLDELNLPEAAFLAALPKAPNNYNPFRYPEAAKGRRDWVIERMADDRAISKADAAAAKATPIQPSAFRRPETVAGADWFGEEVRRRLVDRYGADTTTQGGLMVRTSLNPTLQVAADKALREGLMRYDRRHGGWRGPITQLETGPTLHQSWQTRLANVQRPPGMLGEWQLAVALEVGDREAKLGWLARNPEQPLAPPEPRQGTLFLSDLAWARAAKDGRAAGAPPRRMADVLQAGAVVMVLPAPELPSTAPVARRNRRDAAPPPARPGRPDRVLLRQVPLVQGALVCVEVETGRVLAMVGGWSFELSQFNRVTQAHRQPGSSFKPFVYLTALEKGISPSQRFLDAPFVVDQGIAGRWRPGNYGMNFSGPVSLSTALAKSLNLVTIRVAAQVGMEAVAQTAIAFHVVDDMPRVLPAALGAVETTLLRQAGAYASLAAGGREVVPTLIDSVQDRDGRLIARAHDEDCPACASASATPAMPPERADTRKQLADPASVYQLITMMQGVVVRGTGTAAAAGLSRPIGGKTGTSQDFNDVWFGGYTADLATIVWMGYDTPATLGSTETGGGTAAPIWHDFMEVALKDRPVLQFPIPEGMKLVRGEAGSLEAYKPDQIPGASISLDARELMAPPPTTTSSEPTPPSPSGRVDRNIPGLY